MKLIPTELTQSKSKEKISYLIKKNALNKLLWLFKLKFSQFPHAAHFFKVLTDGLYHFELVSRHNWMRTGVKMGSFDWPSSACSVLTILIC